MAFQYKSFVERGVYVGFGAKLIELTRCRIASDSRVGREALIPNWSGGDTLRSNDLVMTFKDLPKWCELSGRDSTLFDRVCAGQAELEGLLDPLTMRNLRLKTDLEEGDDFEKGHAKREFAIARADVQGAYLEILAMFGRSYGAHTGDNRLENVNREALLALSESSPEEMLRLIRIIVGAVVRGSTVTRESLQGRLDSLSELAAPMCSLVTREASRDVGFLSRQFAILERLRFQIEEFTDDQPQEVQQAGRVIAFTIRSFCDYAVHHANEIRDAVLDESYYLDDKRYDTLIDLIKAERTKISYAMDGWAGHASRWLNVAPYEEEGRRAVIAYIVRQMPTAPKELEEDVPAPRYGSENLMSLRGRSVRAMHSWLDDTLDQDLFNRVTGGKAAGSGDPDAFDTDALDRAVSIAHDGTGKA